MADLPILSRQPILAKGAAYDGRRMLFHTAHRSYFMNLRQLEYFVKVAETLNYTKAAGQLYVCLLYTSRCV